MFDCACWCLGFGWLFVCLVRSFLDFAVAGAMVCSFGLLCFACLGVWVFV